MMKFMRNLHDIVSVLCPVTNKGEAYLGEWCKKPPFILAIALAMLEDSENNKLGMTIEKGLIFITL